MFNLLVVIVVFVFVLFLVELELIDDSVREFLITRVSLNESYTLFAPKLDVVWSRGWYMVTKNKDLDYFNHKGLDPKTFPFNLSNIFAECSDFVWVRTRDLGWWSDNTDCKGVLISSDGDDDIPIGTDILKSVSMWYAQNVVEYHPKLLAIPIGLAIHDGYDGSPNSVDTMNVMSKIVEEKKMMVLHDVGSWVGARRYKYRSRAFGALKNCVNVDIMAN